MHIYIHLLDFLVTIYTICICQHSSFDSFMPSFHPFIRPFIHLSINLRTNSPAYESTHSTTHLPSQSHAHSPTHPSIHPPTHQLNPHPSTHSPSTHQPPPPTHQLTHPPINSHPTHQPSTQNQNNHTNTPHLLPQQWWSCCWREGEAVATAEEQQQCHRQSPLQCDHQRAQTCAGRRI